MLSTLPTMEFISTENDVLKRMNKKSDWFVETSYVASCFIWEATHMKISQSYGHFSLAPNIPKSEIEEFSFRPLQIYKH